MKAARDGGGASQPGAAERPKPSRPAPPPVPGAAEASPPVPPRAADVAPTPPSEPAPAPAEPTPTTTAPTATADQPPADAAPSDADVEPPAPPAGPAGKVDLESVAAALEAVLPTLRAPAKAACQDGAFVRVEGASAVYELGLGVPLRHAERFRSDIESALRAQLDQPLSLVLVASGDNPDSPPRISGGAVDLAEAEAAEAEDVMTIDIAELEDANDVAETGIDRLTKAFPGAVVLDADEVTT
jgi:hypothetical protein